MRFPVTQAQFKKWLSGKEPAGNRDGCPLALCARQVADTIISVTADRWWLGHGRSGPLAEWQRDVARTPTPSGSAIWSSPGSTTAGTQKVPTTFAAGPMRSGRDA